MTKTSQIAWKGIPTQQSMVAGRELLLPQQSKSGLVWLAAVWRAAVNLIAPVGYEDESGFHYGEMPKQTQPN